MITVMAVDGLDPLIGTASDDLVLASRGVNPRVGVLAYLDKRNVWRYIPEYLHEQVEEQGYLVKEVFVEE